jgi:hypothetical protein
VVATTVLRTRRPVRRSAFTVEETRVAPASAPRTGGAATTASEMKQKAINMFVRLYPAMQRTPMVFRLRSDGCAAAPTAKIVSWAQADSC